MNNGVYDCPTWVHFQLSRPLPVIELARLVDSEILGAGFDPVGTPGSGRGAGSALADGKPALSGESIVDVIPLDGTLLSAASGRYGISDCGLEISFRIGEGRYPAFDASTSWENFTLRVNCRMDRNRLRQVAESISDKADLEDRLRNSRTAYRLVKRLYDVLGAEKCIGVDDKYVTGEYFTDPPGFYFSRTEPWILSELLEEDQ